MEWMRQSILCGVAVHPKWANRHETLGKHWCGVGLSNQQTSPYKYLLRAFYNRLRLAPSPVGCILVQPLSAQRIDLGSPLHRAQAVHSPQHRQTNRPAIESTGKSMRLARASQNPDSQNKFARPPSSQQRWLVFPPCVHRHPTPQWQPHSQKSCGTSPGFAL